MLVIIKTKVKGLWANKTHMETLLKDESALDSHLYSIYTLISFIIMKRVAQRPFTLVLMMTNL